MIITFEEKRNKQYEIQDEHVDEIFEEVKESMIQIYEKYNISDKDVLIASLASICLAEHLKKTLSNKYGSDKIIQITNAKEIH